MQVYHGSYYKTYGWGAYDEHNCIITANTPEEALGLALTHFPETTADGWWFDCLPTDTLLCHHISTRSN